jgi:hypothetical protein
MSALQIIYYATGLDDLYYKATLFPPVHDSDWLSCQGRHIEAARPKHIAEQQMCHTHTLSSRLRETRLGETECRSLLQPAQIR